MHSLLIAQIVKVPFTALLVLFTLLTIISPSTSIASPHSDEWIALTESDLEPISLGKNEEKKSNDL